MHTMSKHAITINEDHFQQWLVEMRTTTKPQVKGKLCALIGYDTPAPSDDKGFCCLGLGSTLIPGVEIVRGGDVEVEAAEPYWYIDGDEDLAPDTFVNWLAGTAIHSGGNHDVVPDFPEGLRTQGQPEHHPATRTFLTVGATAANMNDSGFTFAQIADVFEYFGVGRIS